MLWTIGISFRVYGCCAENLHAYDDFVSVVVLAHYFVVTNHGNLEFPIVWYHLVFKQELE